MKRAFEKIRDGLMDALGYVPKADLLRAQDLVTKFQSGKPSTLFLEGHTG